MRTNRNLKGGSKRKDRARLRRALKEITRLTYQMSENDRGVADVRRIAQAALAWDPDPVIASIAHEAKRNAILARIKGVAPGTPGAPHPGFPGELKPAAPAPTPTVQHARTHAPVTPRVTSIVREEGAPLPCPYPETCSDCDDYLSDMDTGKWGPNRG